MKIDMGAKDLIFPAPVLIVGTYNDDGKPNAMNVAWGGLCSSNPPAIAISIRKSRKTYSNILNRKAFTVNIANEDVIKEADYFGLVSGNNINKFDYINVHADKSKNVEAPYVEEFPVILECKVISMTEIGEHVHIVGEIINVMADEAVLNRDNQIDVSKLKAIAYDPAGNQYVSTNHVVGKAFSIGIPLIAKS